MMNYVSLIIDIERSKAYETGVRNEIQTYMTSCIAILNDLFKDNLECSVTFSAGDELQGLFNSATAAAIYFRIFEMLMKPVKIRAGIGIGEWSVKIENGLSTQQDGPAYHRARKAIQTVHKTQLQNIKIFSGEDDIWANHLINASILLKRNQIFMQNMVQVIIELFYPFATAKMRLNMDKIKELLELKYNHGQKGISALGKTRVIEEERFLNFQKIPEVNIILIDGKIQEAEEIILKRNMTSIISPILGSTRQNIDTIVRRGTANKIRELDYMALQYIEQKYGGEDGIDFVGAHFG